MDHWSTIGGYEILLVGSPQRQAMDLTRKRLERAKETLVPQTHSLEGGDLEETKVRRHHGVYVTIHVGQGEH